MFVFLALLAIAIIYISRRFAFYFNEGKAKPWYIAFSSLFVLMIIGGMAFQNATGAVGHVIYILSAILMGFLLFLLIMAMVTDLIRLIFRTVKPKFYGITVVGLTIILSLYSMLKAFDIKTTKIDVPMRGLKKELKIMHLSDIHIGHFRSSNFVKQIVHRTNRENVDLVFITGDYLDGKIALKNENFEPLKQLKVPKFFIGGNHDEYTGLVEIKAKMRDVGVRVMENEVVDLEPVQVVGLDYMMADDKAFDMHPSADRKTLKEVLPGLKIDGKKPAILLHHSPVGLKYAEESGIDLYLAGHTHGGQVFPVTIINKLLFPHNTGLSEYKTMQVFVSQGAGTFGPPMRLGTQSEIVLITLIPKF
jgi:predicted MPP superfamily phosphohydrolase